MTDARLWSWRLWQRERHSSKTGGGRCSLASVTIGQWQLYNYYVWNNLFSILNTTLTRELTFLPFLCCIVYSCFAVVWLTPMPLHELEATAKLHQGSWSRHSSYICSCPLSVHFNGHFPGEPGLAACLLKQRMMEVVSGDNWSCKSCKAPVKSPRAYLHQGCWSRRIVAVKHVPGKTYTLMRGIARPVVWYGMVLD